MLTDQKLSYYYFSKNICELFKNLNPFSISLLLFIIPNHNQSRKDEGCQLYFIPQEVKFAHSN